MSDLPKSAQAWLQKSPRPMVIVVDDKHKVNVPSGRMGAPFRQTLAALNPEKLTALDGNGNVLRAIDLEKAEAESDAKSSMQSDLQCLSHLLANGYEAGAKSYAPLIAAAMDMVAHQRETIARQDKEIDRLRTHNLKLQKEILEMSAEPVDEDGGILGGLVEGIAAAQAQSANVKPIIKKGGAQ